MMLPQQAPGKSIAPPSPEDFTARFGNAFPRPQLLKSDLGTTAVYDLPPPGQSKRHVLIVHGLNTPAIGLWPLAKELQALDPDVHIVLFDLWGHGLSSTPLVAHAQHIFHSQIFQVLGFMQWSSTHLLGYSFGASTVLQFALYNPKLVLSVGLLAPAGILRTELFPPEMLQLLHSDKEEEATKVVLDFLEGGPLQVPADWQKRTSAGQVVAEAFREWELENHAGYRHSVLSMVRDGGVYGCQDLFREFARRPVKRVAVIGELDDVCLESQLVDLGFTGIEIVKANHGLVRTHAHHVAGIVHRFWQEGL
ncbi:Alpha/Beta hydrolase protein [Stachybotrys elegans]|uniref:Alpha/Beta hydrolase protein n=1 Tax=Stachybotrys elegans TaxID=80388 RepID=A0A8K0SL46_9HYPO|nr:Alpha/Beta hydrolase protein [Stachybotrys elegans]